MFHLKNDSFQPFPGIYFQGAIFTFAGMGISPISIINSWLHHHFRFGGKPPNAPPKDASPRTMLSWSHLQPTQENPQVVHVNKHLWWKSQGKKTHLSKILSDFGGRVSDAFFCFRLEGHWSRGCLGDIGVWIHLQICQKLEMQNLPWNQDAIKWRFLEMPYPMSSRWGLQHPGKLPSRKVARHHFGRPGPQLTPSNSWKNLMKIAQLDGFFNTKMADLEGVGIFLCRSPKNGSAWSFAGSFLCEILVVDESNFQNSHMGYYTHFPSTCLP